MTLTLYQAEPLHLNVKSHQTQDFSTIQHSYCSAWTGIKIEHFPSFTPAQWHTAVCTLLLVNWIKPFYYHVSAKAPACDFRSSCLLLSFYLSDRFWLGRGREDAADTQHRTYYTQKQSATAPEIVHIHLQTRLRQHLECTWLGCRCLFRLLNNTAGHRKKMNTVRKVTLERVKK